MPSYNVVAELQELALWRPSVSAPAADVAAWYRRKAEVLDHCGASVLADGARRHAAELQQSTPSGWAVAA